MPGMASATVIGAMDKSSSRCAGIHATSVFDGLGLTTLLMMLVSKR
jgi:hypothetical protein